MEKNFCTTVLTRLAKTCYSSAYRVSARLPFSCKPLPEARYKQLKISRGKSSWAKHGTLSHRGGL